RRLAQDLSHPLTKMLQHECTSETCPVMKAGEWLYLCRSRKCCTIDLHSAHRGQHKHRC
ncbi:hypothetical protein BJV78DRAFT_1125005, partial [Lactifluus subvellereus]